MTEITHDSLMAYVDGGLSAEERARLETRLADNPDAASEVALMQRQNDAIRTLYGPIAAEQVPSRLSVEALSRAKKASSQRTWMNLVAAMLLLAAGLGGGWMLRGQFGTTGIADRLIADAVSAHTVYVLEKRHAVEVDGTDSEHLTSWLSNRLKTNLAMPDLTASGLTFLGGRLLPAPEVPGGRAAQLMYEDAAGARLTLFVAPSSGPDMPRYEVAQLGLDTALFWADAVISCTITAPYPAERLQVIARSVFAQLNPTLQSYEG